MFAVRKKNIDGMPVESLKVYSTSMSDAQNYEAKVFTVTQCCNHMHLEGEALASFPARFLDLIPDSESEEAKVLDTLDYVSIGRSPNEGMFFMKPDPNIPNKISELRMDIGMFDQSDDNHVQITRCCDHEHVVVDGGFLMEPVSKEELTNQRRNSCTNS
ncbi:MAG: hypothetical protein RLZ35_299 [Pseudomonadota bacterium]